MLTVNKINKTYQFETILKDVSFTLKAGQRHGIVGVNGSGKTTLLKIIMGEVQPDSGSIHFSPADLSVGYLPQGFAPHEDDTIESFLTTNGSGGGNIEEEFQQVSNCLMEEPDNPVLHEQYDQLLVQLTSSIRNTGSQAETLASLGLGEYPPDTPVQFLSGGQKTRLALASVLLANPHLLILDEPTNHLDIQMLEWLEDWLSKFQGAVLIVSHDRAFLDKTVNGILRIDTRTHEINFFNGNYSDYLEQRLAEQEKAWGAYQEQQEEITRLAGTARRIRSLGDFRKGGKSDVSAGTDGFSAGFFRDRSLETIRRAKAIEKRLDRMMGEDHIEKPLPDWEMKMEFGETTDTGRDVLRLENLSIGYQDLLLLQNLNLILRYGRRCALIGANGTGKTTLIKTITGQIPPLVGKTRLGTHVKLGYMAQEQENLDPSLNPYETIYRRSPLNETETRYFLSKYLFKNDEVFVPNRSLSFGERARLILASLVADGCNFLILDEPINHLDIPSRTQFEQALTSFDGTVMAVIHDRYFIESFANELWKISDGTIQQVFL